MIARAPVLRPLAAPRPITTGARRLRQIGFLSGELPVESGEHTIFSVGSGLQAGELRYRLYIEGADRTSEWSIAAGTQITHQLGSPSTAAVTLISSTRPDPDDVVVIIETTTGRRVFGGEIASVEEKNPDGTSLIFLRLDCVGFQARLDRAVVGAYFEEGFIIWSAASMTAELLREYMPNTSISFGGGGGGDSYAYEVIIQYTTGSDAIRQVLQPWGLDFFVDNYAALYIIDPSIGFGAAPFSVSQGSGHVDSNSITVRRDRSRTVSRVAVRADLREPPSWTDEWAGGEEYGIGFFRSKYRLNEKPVVYEDGVVQTVGEYAFNASNFDYTYVPGGYGVYRSAGSLSNPAITVTITYSIPLQPVYFVEDATALAAFGVREAILDVKDVYERERWADIGAGELARRAQELYVVNYVTRSSDYLRPGMTQTISHARPLVPSQTFILDSVSGQFEGTANGGHFRWQVSAATAAIQGRSAVRERQRIRYGLYQPQDRHRQVFAWDLAKTVDGLTNPGLSAMALHGQHVVTRVGFLREVRLRFDIPPGTSTVQVDVYLTRADASPVSIFAAGYAEFAPTDTGIIYARTFTSQPFVLKPNDILTAEVITGDTAAMDGRLEVEQQG